MKLYNLYQEVILEESQKQLQLLTEASKIDTILKAMHDKHEARIQYRDYDDGTPTSYRYVQIYVLGKTKSGNQAIRVYQRGGESAKSKKGGWKTFRTDRIESIDLTNSRYKNPITYNSLFQNEPPYNELGDDTFVSIQAQVDPETFNKQRSGVTPTKEPEVSKEPQEPLVMRRPEKPTEPTEPTNEPLTPNRRQRPVYMEPGKKPETPRANRRPEKPEINVVSGKNKPRIVPTQPEPTVGPVKPNQVRPKPVNQNEPLGSDKEEELEKDIYGDTNPAIR